MILKILELQGSKMDLDAANRSVPLPLRPQTCEICKSVTAEGVFLVECCQKSLSYLHTSCCQIWVDASSNSGFRTKQHCCLFCRNTDIWQAQLQRLNIVIPPLQVEVEAYRAESCCGSEQPHPEVPEDVQELYEKAKIDMEKKTKKSKRPRELKPSAPPVRPLIIEEAAGEVIGTLYCVCQRPYDKNDDTYAHGCL